jgi:hypothetical protein
MAASLQAFSSYGEEMEGREPLTKQIDELRHPCDDRCAFELEGRETIGLRAWKSVAQQATIGPGPLDPISADAKTLSGGARRNRFPGRQRNPASLCLATGDQN